MYAEYKNKREEIKSSEGPSDLIISFPRKFVEKIPGLGFDIGGSVIKLVYRHKDDWEELQKNKDATEGKIRLRLYARPLLDDALKHLKENCHLTRNGDEPTPLISTGVGGYQFADLFNKELNAKVSTVHELDCFIDAFSFMLKNFSRSALLEPICTDIINKVKADNAKVIKVLKDNNITQTNMKLHLDQKEANIPELQDANDRRPIAEAEDIFPCVMTMLGSAFGYMIINEDGSYTCSDASIRGGRTFLGLASLLLEVDTFDEIMDLASKGNSFNVSTTTKSLMKGNDNTEDSAMTKKMNAVEKLIFSFGETVGKDLKDFKREDLAKCLLDTTCLDIADSVYNTAKLRGCKRVFFCGGFPSLKETRESITECIYRRIGEMALVKGEDLGLHIDFMTHGPHLGALGTLMKNLDEKLS